MHNQTFMKLGLLHEDVQQSRVVGCSKSSNRVPARRSLKSIGVTARVVALGDIEKSLRVLVQNRVDKTDGRLASRQALLVDAS
jgi:hypothetical protein